MVNEFPEKQYIKQLFIYLTAVLTLIFSFSFAAQKVNLRERIFINDGWRFMKCPSLTESDPLVYDIRPEVSDRNDAKAAESKPTEAVRVESALGILKPWILPSGNSLVKDPAFHEKYQYKVIVSSETASALSTRGTYLFPVTDGISAPVQDGKGGGPDTKFVSACELYTAPFGASPDNVFATQDRYPYVAGEFVWSGWDYLGEPTPYYLCRSSYSGIIDLAGFKKERFYLYQSRWRPELPMVHILPHWTWPGKVGKITPVHVFTSGDEAELSLNGKSLGRKSIGHYEYRLRWDSVLYEPGELKVIVYKNGKFWAESRMKTTDEPVRLKITADRNNISADESDLSFVTVRVTDKNGLVVPDANHLVRFSTDGPGEIAATDNGDPSDLTSFGSKQRKTINGYVMAIIRPVKNKKGTITVSAGSPGLERSMLKIRTK